MEMSYASWNSQQVREVSNFMNSIDHMEMDSLNFDALDDLIPEQFLPCLTPEVSLERSLSPESYNASFPDEEFLSNINHEIPDSSFERPTKQTKTTDTWTSSIPTVPKLISPSGFLISFGNVSSQTTDEHQESSEYLKQKNLDTNDIAAEGGQGAKSSTSKGAVAKPPYVQDHVIAERNRRQRLMDNFIALSALVPGLKKLDKASVLRDAIKYVKQLQERVELLEEEIKKKHEELSVLVSQKGSKSPAASSSDTSSYDENSGGSKRVAEIEARVSEKNVLIRIQCEKQEKLVSKMLTRIEELNLSVVSSSVLPFGDIATEITIVCQTGPEFSFTVEDLVTKLRSAFTTICLTRLFSIVPTSGSRT